MDRSVQDSSSRGIDREITVVIATIGRPILEQCLAAITAGDSLPGRIIVVDQSSSTVIGDMLRPAAALGVETTHVCSGERGKSAALNRGFEMVTSRFAVVTDDDCLADNAWIARFGSHLRASPERVFTGCVTTRGEEPVLDTVLRTESSIASRPSVTYDRFSGGNFGLSLDVIRRVGLFDEDPCVRFSEDGEWAYRALRQNVEIAYVPDVMICHYGWRDQGQRLDQYRGYARCHAAFFGKHLRRGDALIALRATIHLARAVRRWLSGIIRRDSDLAANGRCYTLEFFPGLISGLRSNIRPPRLQSSQRDPIVS
jgi:GT2 family glycosyltransferase